MRNASDTVRINHKPIARPAMAVKEDPQPLLQAASRARWRAWLAKNHTNAAEVWVVFYKKHTGRKWLSYDAAVEEALCFGWIDGVKKRLDAQRFVHRFTPRQPKSSWSPSNKQRVAKLIRAKKMTRAGQRLIDAAKKNGSWSEPTAAQRDFAMPRELDAALATSRPARSNFDGLAPSHRRNYIAWVATAKRPETRERRAARALAMLAKNQKLGMV